MPLVGRRSAGAPPAFGPWLGCASKGSLPSALTAAGARLYVRAPLGSASLRRSWPAAPRCGTPRAGRCIRSRSVFGEGTPTWPAEDLIFHVPGGWSSIRGPAVAEGARGVPALGNSPVAAPRRGRCGCARIVPNGRQRAEV
eukprot:2727725-Pyramimonas_sp.AAC.1